MCIFLPNISKKGRFLQQTLYHKTVIILDGSPLNTFITRSNLNNTTRKFLESNGIQRLSRACIVHLVIKRTNWSYVKTMSCSGSHLGIPINIKNTKFVKDLPMIDAQFRFNQCNSFREEHISVFSHMILC